MSAHVEETPTQTIAPVRAEPPAGGVMMPKAGQQRSQGGVAPLVKGGASPDRLHNALFIVGAVLQPLGFIVIGLGWFGAARTSFEYAQTPYLISGGLGGLALCFVGGFLYFGSWLARIAADQRESRRQLADTLLVLADTVSWNSPGAAAYLRDASDQAAAGQPLPATPVVPAPAAPVVPTPAAPAPAATPPAPSAPVPAAERDPGAVLVVAGAGHIVHRADCDLLVGRDDLTPAGPSAADMVPCRLCKPVLP